MRLANTVIIILCRPATISSGKAYTGAPIRLAEVTAYLALLRNLSSSSPTRLQSTVPGWSVSMSFRMGSLLLRLLSWKLLTLVPALLLAQSTISASVTRAPTPAPSLESRARV